MIDMAIGGLGPQEILIISGVLVLLFGAKKLPALARGMGSSFSEFRKGLREADDLLDEIEAPQEKPNKQVRE